MLAAAGEAGATGGKVCGAGGGGCLFCIGEPDDVPAIRRALAQRGARVLDFHVIRTCRARACAIERAALRRRLTSQR